jgi:hypothetical protein
LIFPSEKSGSDPVIDKPLAQIAYADIERLVQEKWPEGKTIEYKRDTYGAKDDDKKELLKDVSSFANTQGGDILIGVDAKGGVPIGIPGVDLPDIDAAMLRLDGIIRQGLEPRIECSMHQITAPAKRAVIIVRVKESLLFPHRVVFHGKFGEFWGRSSAGKYSMDTDELRRAFTLSDSIYEQVRAFRRKRVAEILKDETPVQLMPGAKLILHLIPISSFRTRQQFDVARMPQLPTQFPPVTLQRSGGHFRLNLDGHLSHSPITEEGARSYTQFFRNGIVEAVLCDVVKSDAQGRYLVAGYYERMLTQGSQPIRQYLSSFHAIGIRPPIWGFLTVTGVKGTTIYIEGYFGGEEHPIDRDVLLVPEFVLDDLSADPVVELRSAFDLIWNASGQNRSRHFDENNKWKG